jgi:hypothetical protein
MSVHELTLDYALKTSLEDLYPCILDFRKFGEAHPYMTNVELVKQTRDYSEFFVKEKVLLFGFLPQSPKYHARVYEVEKHKHIRYTSKVMKLIDLSINFTFTHKPETQETHLKEMIRLEGNRFISKILIGIMQESHEKLFRKIESELG